MGEVSPLNQLYQRFCDKDFEFFTVYVQESHPAEHFGAHKTQEQKVSAAQSCQIQDAIQVPILVDEFEGPVHRAYGLMPNMVYIIDKDGKIAYRSGWTDHKDVEIALANLALGDELRRQGKAFKTSYTERVNIIPDEYANRLRKEVFDRAGQKSWEDRQFFLNSKSK